MTIAIKTFLKWMPETCEDCYWMGCRPHPYKGWMDLCELCGEQMDDSAHDDWIYDGNGRPKNCPLIEVKDKESDTE